MACKRAFTSAYIFSRKQRHERFLKVKVSFSSLADLFVVGGGVFRVVEQIVHSRDGQQDTTLSRVLLALRVHGDEDKGCVWTTDQTRGTSRFRIMRSTTGGHVLCLTAKVQRRRESRCRVLPCSKYNTVIPRNGRATLAKLGPPLSATAMRFRTDLLVECVRGMRVDHVVESHQPKR